MTGRVLASWLSALLVATCTWAVTDRLVAPGGMVAMVVTAMIVMACFWLERYLRNSACVDQSQAERLPRTGWFVYVAAALAATVYWHRMLMGYSRYDEVHGISIAVYRVLGFWWPAVLVTVASWVVDVRVACQGAKSDLADRIAGGLCAGLAGVVLATSVWAVHPDKSPLHQEVQYLARLPLVRSSAWTYQLRWWRHLEVNVDLGDRVDAAPYILLGDMEQFFQAARNVMFAREDVAQLTVVIRSGRQELARFKIAENHLDGPLFGASSPAVSSLWENVQIDRSLLRGGGQLDDASLSVMALQSIAGQGARFGPPPSFSSPELAADFQRRFQAQVHNGNRVLITFDSALLAGAAEVELTAAAWRGATRIVEATTRYFPEINRFDLDLPPRPMTVYRHEARADAFRLQRTLSPVPLR